MSKEEERYHREYDAIDKILESDNALVVRANGVPDELWLEVVRKISEPQGTDKFIAYVDFLNDPSNMYLTWSELVSKLGDSYKNPIIFIVDSQTKEDGTISVYDLVYEKGDTFRLYPKHVQVIENNLTIGNLAFFEFKEEVVNGVYDEPL